jgi:hypothetical protein
MAPVIESSLTEPIRERDSASLPKPLDYVRAVSNSRSRATI